MEQTETIQTGRKIPTNPAYPFPYTVGGMSPEVTLFALRGLVEAYRFASDSVAQYKGADKVGTVDGLLAFFAGVNEENLVCASTFRAIHAICPEVAQELREIGSIQLGTERGKAMYRKRRGVLFARLGIDSKRDDSEFDVIDAGEPIVYEEWAEDDQDQTHDQPELQQEAQETPQTTIHVMSAENPRLAEFLETLAGPVYCDFRDGNEDEGMVWNCDCSSKRPLARRLLATMGLNLEEIDESLSFFEEHGGFCECEIVFNVANSVGLTRPESAENAVSAIREKAQETAEAATEQGAGRVYRHWKEQVYEAGPNWEANSSYCTGYVRQVCEVDGAEFLTDEEAAEDEDDLEDQWEIERERAAEFARRIAACLTACEGITTDELETGAVEEAPARMIIETADTGESREELQYVLITAGDNLRKLKEAGKITPKEYDSVFLPLSYASQLVAPFLLMLPEEKLNEIQAAADSIAGGIAKFLDHKYGGDKDAS